MSLRALAGAEFKILIVMDLADSTLKSIIDHEHVAGEDFHFVRAIAADLARALDHLHSKGHIHADFKPRNAVVTGSDWKLIDLDVSCEIGKPFGIKPPSSGYSPPEFGAVLQQVSEGNLDKRKLSMYRASVAYDLWSFGVVLFELATGVPLWITNQDDNLTDNDLKQDLVLWTQEKLEVKLHRAVRNPTDDQKTAFDLLRKLLEPTAEGRLSHFAPGCEMLSVLDHPLFQSRDLNDATLEQMRKQLTNIDGKLDQVLEKLNAHFMMLSTLLSGVGSVAPKLICFLPVDAVRQDAGKERWWRKALSPKDWLNQRVLLFFFDPIRLTLAQTNPDSEGNGQGFELTFPKEWVTKAMPYVKIGLATLKVAAIAGRLSGFPVPDIAGVVNVWIDGQLDALKGLKDEALASLSSLTADADLARSLLDKADTYVQDLVSAEVSGAQPVSGEPLNEALADPKVAEPLKKSVEELDALLPDGWAKMSGLEFATAKDGTSEWVLPDDVERFKAEGKRMLGNDSKEPSKDEENARLTQLSLLQQQQKKQQQKKEVLVI